MDPPAPAVVRPFLLPSSTVTDPALSTPPYGVVGGADDQIVGGAAFKTTHGQRDPQTSPAELADHTGGVLGPQLGSLGDQTRPRAAGEHDDRAVDRANRPILGIAGRQHTGDPGQAEREIVDAVGVHITGGADLPKLPKFSGLAGIPGLVRVMGADAWRTAVATPRSTVIQGSSISDAWPPRPARPSHCR